MSMLLFPFKLNLAQINTEDKSHLSKKSRKRSYSVGIYIKGEMVGRARSQTDRESCLVYQRRIVRTITLAPLALFSPARDTPFVANISQLSTTQSFLLLHPQFFSFFSRDIPSLSRLPPYPPPTRDPRARVFAPNFLKANERKWEKETILNSTKKNCVRYNRYLKIGSRAQWRSQSHPNEKVSAVRYACTRIRRVERGGDRGARTRDDNSNNKMNFRRGATGNAIPCAGSWSSSSRLFFFS